MDKCGTLMAACRCATNPRIPANKKFRADPSVEHSVRQCDIQPTRPLFTGRGDRSLHALARFVQAGAGQGGRGALAKAKSRIPENSA